MRNKPKKTGKLLSIVKRHVLDNGKQYFIVSILFLIGIVIGVLVINNMNEANSNSIQEYIKQFIDSLKSGYQLDLGGVLKSSIANNLLLAITIWFVGSTVIGIPIVFLLVGFRGFCIGYTISSAIATLGAGKGILFFIATMLLQNILLIPCVLALAVSGIKLYQSIMKDKRKENIKFEVLRHTLFSLLMAALMLLGSVIETYISTNLLMLIIQFM